MWDIVPLFLRGGVRVRGGNGVGGGRGNTKGEQVENTGGNAKRGRERDMGTRQVADEGSSRGGDHVRRWSRGGGLFGWKPCLGR